MSLDGIPLQPEKIQQDAMSHILQLYIKASGDIQEFCSGLPSFGQAYASSKSLGEMMGYLSKMQNFLATQGYAYDWQTKLVSIEVFHRNNITSDFILADRDEPLRHFVSTNAVANDTTVKSVKMEHDGKILFLSSVGNKTPRELGILDHLLKVSFRPESTDDTIAEESARLQSHNKRTKKKKKKHKKSNKKKSILIAPPEDGFLHVINLQLASSRDIFATEHCQLTAFLNPCC